MLSKLILGAAAALTSVTALAAPAQAGHRDRYDDGRYYDGRYDDGR